MRKTQRVCLVRLESKRIWCAISDPNSLLVSSATRRVRDIAEMRRGWVTAMRSHPARKRYWGTCVLLPQPVLMAFGKRGRCIVSYGFAVPPSAARRRDPMLEAGVCDRLCTQHTCVAG